MDGETTVGVLGLAAGLGGAYYGWRAMDAAAVGRSRDRFIVERNDLRERTGQLSEVAADMHIAARPRWSVSAAAPCCGTPPCDRRCPFRCRPYPLIGRTSKRRCILACTGLLSAVSPRSPSGAGMRGTHQPWGPWRGPGCLRTVRHFVWRGRTGWPQRDRVWSSARGSISTLSTRMRLSPTNWPRRPAKGHTALRPGAGLPCVRCCGMIRFRSASVWSFPLPAR